ncbi:hypothetical protein Brsp07_05480 [Brucella sp. NBRC 14130]
MVSPGLVRHRIVARRNAIERHLRILARLERDGLSRFDLQPDLPDVVGCVIDRDNPRAIGADGKIKLFFLLIEPCDRAVRERLRAACKDQSLRPLIVRQGKARVRQKIDLAADQSGLARAAAARTASMRVCDPFF